MAIQTSEPKKRAKKPSVAKELVTSPEEKHVPGQMGIEAAQVISSRDAIAPKKRTPRSLSGSKSGPVHVLIRIRSEDGKTVRAHSNMIEAKGSAALGKMGKALGPGFIHSLNEQISSGVSTFLFLTTREGWNGPYVTYQCKLKAVLSTMPEEKRNIVPAYYSMNIDAIGTWFEITSIAKMPKMDMNRIFVISSGREIMSVIGSSASVFHVRYTPRPINVGA